MGISDFLSCFVVKGTSHPHYGMQCQACPNKTRVGDSIIVFDRGRNTYVGRELVIHVECLTKWLARRPRSEGVAQVNRAVKDLRKQGSKVFAELGS